MAMQTSPDGKIDREATVPFHLKLFYRTGSHHRPDEFPTTPARALPQHLQIYTWPSCTIRELSHLLTTALPALLPDPIIGTRLSYRLIFPDTRDTRPGPGRYMSKDLGTIVLRAETDQARGELPSDASAEIVTDGPMSGRLDGDPERTLQDARFVIGDYVSCAIFPPGANGEVAAPLPPARAPRERGGRENGFGAMRGGGYRGGGFGSGRASGFGRLNDGSGGVPPGEWRRGERLPDGPGGRGYGRSRGRGWER